MPVAELLQELRREQQAQAKSDAPVRVEPDRSEVRRQQRERQASELVATIHKARGDIEAAVTRLQTAGLELRSLTRRNFDEDSSSMLVFTNAQLRLAGAMNQAIQRTASMDRVLVRAAKDREEARAREAEFTRRREALAKEKEHQRMLAEMQTPTEDDFDDLYGEILNDAS